MVRLEAARVVDDIVACGGHRALVHVLRHQVEVVPKESQVVHYHYNR